MIVYRRETEKREKNRIIKLEEEKTKRKRIKSLE